MVSLSNQSLNSAGGGAYAVTDNRNGKRVFLIGHISSSYLLKIEFKLRQ